MPATLQDIQKQYGEDIYPLYKEQMHEPYMEAHDGDGYQGVILYDKKKDKIRCDVCKEWVMQIGGHSKLKHKISAREYRDKFGFTYNVPLCTPSISKKRSDAAIKGIQEKTLFTFTKGHSNKYTQFERKKHSVSLRKAGSKISRLNKKGLCDAQIHSRLIIVRDMVGKSSLGMITPADILQNDESLYDYINRKYGGVKGTIDKFGLSETNRPLNAVKYTDADLIAKLRMYTINNKRSPSSHDLYKTGLPDVKAFRRVFGSWRRAKMMAGLDQLLQKMKNERD
jgi:ribosomal protein S27E